MRIGILSRNPALYSTRRLAQAIWARGHQAQIIDTTSVAVHLGAADAPPGATHLLTGGVIGLAATTPLPPLDAIIPRIGTSVTFYGLAVVRQFETAGVFTPASSDAIARSRDKLHSLQMMIQAGLPIPRTAVIARPEALFAAVEAVGENDSVHGPGAGAADGRDVDAVVLEEAIEDSPGEGAMSPAALEGQSERFVVRSDPRRAPRLNEVVYVRPEPGCHHAFHAVTGRRL